MKSNKNGVKLLAAIAVFVMLAAAIVVVSNDNDAAPVGTDGYGAANFSDPYTGPIAGEGKYTYSNMAFGNKIIVSWDAEKKTYNISGTLVNHDDAAVITSPSNIVEEAKTAWATMGMGTLHTLVISSDSDTPFLRASLDDKGEIVAKSSNPVTGLMLSFIDNGDGNAKVKSEKYTNGFYMAFQQNGSKDKLDDYVQVTFDCLKVSQSTGGWGVGYVAFTTQSSSNVAMVVVENTTYYFNTIVEAINFAADNEDSQSVILLDDIIVSDDLTVSTDGIELNGHAITIIENKTLNSLITNGNANKAVVNVKGGENGAKISQGSIVLTGNYTSSGNLITVNSGEVKISGTIEGDVNIVVKPNAKLVIPEGKTLNVGDNTVTVNKDTDTVATLVVYGSVEKGSGSFTIDDGITVAVSPDSDTTNISGIGTIESIYAESGDRTGYKGTIDGNTEINGKAFLSDELTVAAGVTLTINGDLSLNGHKLTVKGNLVINNKGTITGIGASGADKDTISIVDKGTITNNGTIGKGNYAVSISSGSQVVTLKGVNGVQITTDKSANLLVSGNITKISGAKAGEISIDGAYLNGDVTIAKNVTLSVVSNNAYASKNSTIVINGTLDAREKNLILKEGSTITVNGKAYGIISAEVADSIAAEDVSDFVAYEYTKVTVNNTTNESATGYTISVIRIQYADESGDVFFKQTAHISGNINTSKTDVEVKISIDGIIIIDEGKTVTIGKDVEFKTETGSFVVANGMLANAPASEDIGYVGAAYTITPAETGTPVNYITSFDSAYSIIETVDQKEIILSGLSGYEVELNGEYVIKANQTVSYKNTTNELIIIGEAGTVIVDEGGELSSEVIKKINGKLVVKDGGSCTPDESLYDVMSKDENETITYAGFQVIINEAKSGDKITITGENAKISSATIPEGVTVTVEGKLIVEKSLTVAEGGKLIIDGGSVTIGTAANEAENVKAIPGSLKIVGTVDTTGGNLTMLGGSSEKKAVVESTGNLVTIAAYNFGTNYTLSGAKFVDGYGNTVITTVSKAVESSAAAGTNAVTVIGNVNDTTDIVLGKVILTIDENAEATLGTIDVNGSKIVSNGLLTASIKGQFGTDGSTSDAIVKTTKATVTSITNSSKVNAQNVKVWSLTFGTITGSVEFVQGTIISGNISVPTTSIIEKAALKVDSDATLSIESDLDAIAGFYTVTIDGNVIVTKDGDLDIDKATVNGKLTVEGNAVIGKLTLKGTLEIVDNETITGTASVTKSLILGEATTTGADPIIIGSVSLGTSAYALAYPGSTVTASNFGTADSVKSTIFYIDGVEYLTAYATSAVLAIGTNGPNNGFMNDVKIDGFDTTGINDAQKWFTDVDFKKNYTSSTFDIGDKSTLYFKATPMEAKILVSVGTGISLYVDDLKVTEDKKLTIGTHTVKAIVDPGYKGDVTITFNGKTVTDGKIVVTSDMINADIVLAVTGNITIDSGDVPTPSEKDDSMGITEYLLIVLVILAAILVVVVAIRMMRS